MSQASNAALRETALRGGVAMVLGQLARGATQFAGLVILSRLLSPADIGVVAMATAVVGIAAVLSDFGLSMAVMREPDMQADKRDQIFYLNVILAVSVACAIWLTAPLVASLYEEPDLEQVTRWLSASALLLGLAPQFRAELARRLKFRALAIVDVSSQLVGLIAAVLAALAGAGYWAVVAQQTVAAAALIGLLVGTSRYWPTSRPRLTGNGEHVSLGAITLGVQATNYVAVNSAPVAVGKMIGSAGVGLYSRSFQLASIPLVQLAAPLTRVAVPILARSTTDEALLYAARRIQALLAFGLIPPLAMLAVGGDTLVALLFGDAWRAVGKVPQILAVGGVFQALGYVFFWLFIQKNRLAVLWRCELAVWLPVVPLFFFAAHFGLEAVAALYALGLALNFVIAGTYGCSRISLGWHELLLPSLARLAVAAAIMAVGVATIQMAQGQLGSVASLCLAYAVMVLSFCVVMLVPIARRDVCTAAATFRGAAK